MTTKSAHENSWKFVSDLIRYWWRCARKEKNIKLSIKKLRKTKARNWEWNAAEGLKSKHEPCVRWEAKLHLSIIIHWHTSTARAYCNFVSIATYYHKVTGIFCRARLVRFFIVNDKSVFLQKRSEGEIFLHWIVVRMLIYVLRRAFYDWYIRRPLDQRGKSSQDKRNSHEIKPFCLCDLRERSCNCLR